MKKLHYRRENYPVTFKWIKPDDYFDGELIRKSWYFSVCDWFGNELEGFYDENEMIESFIHLKMVKVQKSMNQLVLQEECQLVKQLLLKKNMFFLFGRYEKNFSINGGN